MTFNALVSKNPSRAFKAIRNSKNSKIKNINTLTVGQNTYKGKCVKDGFYDSLSALKNPSPTPSYGNYDLNYKLILWLSSSANDTTLGGKNWDSSFSGMGAIRARRVFLTLGSDLSPYRSQVSWNFCLSF